MDFSVRVMNFELVLVMNRKSGTKRQLADVRAAFARHKITISEEILVDEKLASSLKKYRKEGYVAVYGGDGTQSAVAGVLSGSKAIMVPLPGGTLNHFTKDLGIPQDLDKALARLHALQPRSIDTASINKLTFINNSSIGFYPSSLRERQRTEDKLGKWPAALLASLRSTARMSGYDISIKRDHFTTPFLFVGNNQYSLGARVIPLRKKLDGGLLSIYIAKKVSRIILLKVALSALIGRARMIDEFEYRADKKLKIKSKSKFLSVAHDGEVTTMKSPLKYEIKPKSLRILG